LEDLALEALKKSSEGLTVWV